MSPSEVVSVVIVDDEAPARAKVRRLLSVRSDVRVIGEASDGSEAIELIETTAPDIVILDIQMPNGTGFDVMAAIQVSERGPRPPAFVFATAYDQHAIQAFEVAATDYLLKPFDQARLFQAVDRAIGRIRDDSSVATIQAVLEAAGVNRTFMKRITVESRGAQRVLDLADVSHLQSERNYVAVWCKSKEFLTRRTLVSLESLLDPGMFVRVHRSTVVNLDHITAILPAGRGDRLLQLVGGTEVRVSRSHRAELENAIESASGG